MLSSLRLTDPPAAAAPPIPAPAAAAGWAHGAAAFAPLPDPAELLAALPLGAARAAAVAGWRDEVRAVLDGADPRLLVIAGPCSVHDPAAALDYARRLAELRDRLGRRLLVVMRVYFEKPRTVGGWKGLISDPGMDGGHDVGRGLREARSLLLEIAGLGLPAGCEWLDPLAAQYLADAVAWGAIGARTVESQLHRQLASALPMPVGFKNGTGGDVQVAVDACLAAAAPGRFPAASGPAFGVVRSPGNPDCHVVLRGGRRGPNHGPAGVQAALGLLAAAGLPRRLVVDAAHGNSGKDHARQPAVAAEVAAQVAAGEGGMAGVMLESFLVAGRQDPGDPAALTYGQSVTDPCMGLPATAAALEELAAAAGARRAGAGRW